MQPALSGKKSLMHSMSVVRRSNSAPLTAGSFMHVPAQSHHFLVARTDVVIQVHGTGPFTITYVNPFDDPRNVPRM